MHILRYKFRCLKKYTPPAKWGATETCGIIIRVLCQQKTPSDWMVFFVGMIIWMVDSNPSKCGMPVAYPSLSAGRQRLLCFRPGENANQIDSPTASKDTPYSL